MKQICETLQYFKMIRAQYINILLLSNILYLILYIIVIVISFHHIHGNPQLV